MLPKKGFFYNKEKNKKIEYKKVQSGFEVNISKADNKNNFKKINKYQMVLNEKSLINYLFTECYIDKIMP